MTTDKIEVVSADAALVSSEKEWFIPMIDVSGDGTCWYAGILDNTKEEAEERIRRSTFVVRQARIVRVVLPCKVIP